jgi:hypothetical protein
MLFVDRFLPDFEYPKVFTHTVACLMTQPNQENTQFQVPENAPYPWPEI